MGLFRLIQVILSSPVINVPWGGESSTIFLRGWRGGKIFCGECDETEDEGP